MAKYVLGENAARKLRAMFNGKMRAGRIDGTSGGVVDDADFLPPFTVQWASSLSSGEGESSTDGEWIIWLPGDQHVVIGETSIDLSEDLEDAEGEYPEGWYKLGDLIDKDEGGTLYLTIDTENKTAELSDEESSGICVKVCEATVDEENGARSVVPMITSSLVVGSGDGGGGGRAYYADEWSVSQMDAQGSRHNFFSIKGFGRYAASVAQGVTLGNFQPSSEIDLDDDEASNMAFLVRLGNSDTVDLNQIGYRTLKMSSSAVSSPFKYTKTTTTDPQTHQPVTTHKLVNCKFYWQGEMEALDDFDVSSVVANGSVWLVGTQEAPSEESPDPEWSWSVATEEGEEPEGGKVLNYKLYDFDQGVPTVDYRTTFLSLEDHTQKAKITVGAPDADAKIVLDASGEKPALLITDGNDHYINLDMSEIDDDECSGHFGIHEIRWIQEEDGQKVEQIAHFIGCYDVDLTGAGSGTTLSIGSDNVHLSLTGDAQTGYELSVPQITITLNAGTGIRISGTTISNTGVIALTSGESSSQSLNGTVQVKGAADSGLVVSATQGQQPTEQQPLSNGSLTFDIEGRANLPDTCSKHFAAREFKYKDNNGDTQIYHFFGCADIDLSDIKAKQKQSDWNTTDTTDDSFIKNKPDLDVDVVTGISMSVNTSGSTSKLVATITKRNLKSGNVTTTSQDVLTLTNASVVASSAYTNDLKFVNTLVNLLVLGSSTPSPSTVDVFETTPHSAEA